MARKEAASSFMPRDQCWFIAVATATRRLRMRGISPEFASASGYFRSAVERMDGSSWTQKIFDGAFQELSNGVFTNEIRMKSSRFFWKRKRAAFPRRKLSRAEPMSDGYRFLLVTRTWLGRQWNKIHFFSVDFVWKSPRLLDWKGWADDWRPVLGKKREAPDGTEENSSGRQYFHSDW